VPKKIAKSIEKKPLVDGYGRRRADRKHEYEKYEVCDFAEMFIYILRVRHANEEQLQLLYHL
jgi:hypothetical protein